MSLLDSTPLSHVLPLTGEKLLTSGVWRDHSFRHGKLARVPFMLLDCQALSSLNHAMPSSRPHHHRPSIVRSEYIGFVVLHEGSSLPFLEPRIVTIEIDVISQTYVNWPRAMPAHNLFCLRRPTNVVDYRA